MNTVILFLSIALPVAAQAASHTDYDFLIHQYESENRVTVNEVAKAYLNDWDPCVDGDQCEFIVHGFLNYITAIPSETHREASPALTEQQGDFGVFMRDEEKVSVITIPKPPKRQAKGTRSVHTQPNHSSGNSDYSVLNPIETPDEDQPEKVPMKLRATHSGCR